MTIAKTGNAIVDAQARRGAAEARLSESRKAAAARKATKAGKAGKRTATSRSRKSSGKAAAGRGGRGIVIKKSKSGKGFRGLMNYMLDDPSAKLILSNAGHDNKSIAQFMRETAKQNPKVTKPTGHIIVALPEGVKKSEKVWQNIVTHITEEMGLSDHPFAAVLHITDKGNDLHICFSKVDASGNTYNDSNDKYLMASVEQSTEQKFSLRLVQYSEMKHRKTDTPQIKHSEVKQSERMQAKPPRLVVADAIKSMKADRPNPIVFIKRLAEAGVVAVPYVHKNEVKGFSFSMDGASYKGKDVSASWTTLQKEIDYVENRDLERLAELSAEARRDTRGVEPATIPLSSIEPIEQPTDQSEPRPQVEVCEPRKTVERPTNVPKKTTPASQAQEPIRQASQPDLNDPIAIKIKARQAIIDRLRRETGERHKLANELADRLERSDLYRQRQVLKDFLDDHKADPQAVAIAKAHMHSAVPAPTPAVKQDTESRARLEAAMTKIKTDQAARDAIKANPTPSHAAQSRDQDYQFPTM